MKRNVTDVVFCASACHEGAIGIVDGKAKIIKG
ncbi:hypothetical protein DE164_005559 [Clostridium beijerinckii]|nr:hypothetical protein [Clostridium beijerinckii]